MEKDRLSQIVKRATTIIRDMRKRASNEKNNRLRRSRHDGHGEFGIDP